MTQDYPDWTTLIHLIGADIMMPIDIQGAYIMMPVDIQAQYVTLDIDIVAQTVGNIEVDLVAATVGTLDIDITAQTIGDITIDVEAQSIGMQLQPDWQTKEGNQKYFRSTAVNKATGAGAFTNYEVPVGKTLYITHFGGSCYAYTAADRDKNQILYIGLAEENSGNLRAEQGGNGGAGQTFPTPIKYVAGEILRYIVLNYANHNCTLFMTVGGYEI